MRKRESEQDKAFIRGMCMALRYTQDGFSTATILGHAGLKFNDCRRAGVDRQDLDVLRASFRANRLRK